MALYSTEQITQQNGQMGTNEWLVKTLSEPGFISRRYLLPMVQTYVQRQAVLGSILEGNKLQAPGQVMEKILMPVAESRPELGMYGEADINHVIQNVKGHKGGTVTVVSGQAVEAGVEVEKWGTIGNDKIAFTLNHSMSITKKYYAYKAASQDLPQCLQIAIQSILNAQLMAYEDTYLLEFIDKGINLNNEFLNGNPNRPVAKYIGADPSQKVNYKFETGTGVGYDQNPFVLLVNNLKTFQAEIGLDGQWSEIIVAPIFLNNLKASANWLFNAGGTFQNESQYRDLRAGTPYEVVAGMPIIAAPRMSARYGSVLLNGKKCPDGFFIDRSCIYVYTFVVESLHMEPAPSTFFQTILIKSLEYFGIDVTPKTIEDYQAQLNGKLRTSGIGYFYINSNPDNTKLSTVAKSGTVEYKNGFSTFGLSVTGTGFVVGDTVPAKIYEIKATQGSVDLSPAGIRILPQEPVADSATTALGAVKVGVISDFYQNDNAIAVSVSFADPDDSNASGLVALPLQFNLVKEVDSETGFAVWKVQA